MGSGSMQLQISPIFLSIFILLLLLVFTTILSNILEIAPIYCQEETVNNTSTAATGSVIKQQYNSLLLKYWASAIGASIVAATKVKATITGKSVLFMTMVVGTTGSLLGVNHVINPNPGPVLTSLQKLRKDRAAIDTNENSASNPIPCPLEQEDECFFDWLISYLPDFIVNIFSNRVPVSSIENLDTISVLHYQYNILVVLMAFSLLLIFVGYLLSIGFKSILKNRDTIINKFSVLSKFVPSIKAMKIMLIFFKAIILVNAFTISISVQFLYTHPFIFALILRNSHSLNSNL